MTVRAAGVPAAEPHLVTEEEAASIRLRLEALRLFRARYRHNLESERTMVGGLHRLATVFSDGEYDERTFPWELLVDEDLAVSMWSAVGSKYSRNTAVKDASALRLMLKSCRDVGLLTHEEYSHARSFDTKGVGDPREPAGTFISDADLAAIVEACVHGRGGAHTRTRDTALVLSLACSAARGDEITGVLTEQTHLAERRVWLRRTKNGKPRNAWLHPHAVTAVERWLDVRGHRRGPLFVPLSRSNVLPDYKELSTFQVWKIVSGRAAEAGLPHITPHDLRRYVISSLLDRCDLSLVAKIAGHANPATTVLYDKRPEQEQRDAVATLQLPSLWSVT
jgi:integrase